MISVTEAKNILEAHVKPLAAVNLPLEEALGLVLAEPVIAPMDVPPFDQSAMDGYALCFGEGANQAVFRVIGEIPAGTASTLAPAKGEALRIFTGAPVPEATDTVVIQEKVIRQGDAISVDDPLLKKGSNVRLKGSQTRQGDIALADGTLLTPGAIGFLAGFGLTMVKVRPKPRVCLLITGKELVAPGQPLALGQVYESNSYTLRAALLAMGIQPTLVFRSDDEEAQIVNALSQGLEATDLVLVTGGISVGDYDLVKKSMDLCGVQTLFYKIKQKPGKPLFYGHKMDTQVFGLPGNPGSVLSCFYEYVAPAIQRMMGHAQTQGMQARKKLGAGFNKKEGLTYFLKGKIEGELVIPLDAQESYQMNSFAAADCLIVLEADKSVYEQGEWVEVHPFRYVF